MNEPDLSAVNTATSDSIYASYHLSSRKVAFQVSQFELGCLYLSARRKSVGRMREVLYSVMRRYLKLLLLCFTMIAVPLKSVAASTVYCNNGHGHQAHSRSHDGHEHRDHRHGNEAGSGEHSSDAYYALRYAPVDHDNPRGISKCSACSTCSAHALAGALETTGPDFLPASLVVIPFLSSMRVSIFADGLERPPKDILA